MGLRIGPAELARARLRGRVSVTLGGSFAGQTWEIKFGRGQSKARDTDLPDEHPARLDQWRTGPAQEPSFGYAEYRQVASAARPAQGQETHGNSGGPGRARISVNENNAMVNFWDSINADQKRAFLAKAHERVFASGARLMQEGEHGDHVAVILSGLTEIRVCENGAERVVAERGPGQLIGERAALEVNPRSATVVALQTVIALVMRTADFAAFISTYPAVLKIVEEQIFTRLRESRADQRLADDLADGRATAARADRPHIGATAPQLPLLTGQNCTVVRTDVVAFGAGGRNGEDHKIIRQETLAMTRQALGPAWDTCRWEDRGDGLLVVVSPDVPTAQVIERLVTVLPPRLKRHNRTYSDSSRIQLRVAVGVGPIEEDEAGVSGTSIIDVSRMLDAPAFKQAIADQGAILGIVVSPYVYETHVQPGGSSLDPADYAEVPVRVKETRGSAWMQLIGPVRTATSSC
jgi:CRP-like cAMP-binding protein